MCSGYSSIIGGGMDNMCYNGGVDRKCQHHSQNGASGMKNITRREFNLRVSAGAALPFLHSAGSVNAQEAAPCSIALQLYSVRRLTQKDFAGTIEMVRKTGYCGVEFAGYGGLSSKAVRRLLDDNGMMCAGTHESFDRVKNSLDETIAFNLEIGNRYLVVPSMPGELREAGIDGYKAFGNELTVLGEKAAQAGLQLCYHNHAFEFVKADGKFLIDYLYEEASPEYVMAQLDTYHALEGGDDPVSFIRRYRHRCPTIHMKDMGADAARSFVPTGTGIIDMPGIVREAKLNNTRWYVVEMESNRIEDGIAVSLRNLEKIVNAQ